MARIQLRRGTAAQWASINPVLASGEVGVETDTGYMKVGNGSAAWTSLPYQEGPPGPSAYDSAVSNGFVGTEAEWLASLKGDQGEPGQDGTDGTDGAPGAPGAPGPRGEGLYIDGRVATHAALPVAPGAGLALVVDADELLYVYDATIGWPAEGDGVVLGASAAQLAAKADLVGGKIPQSQIPAVAMVEFLGVAGSQSAMLALVGERGDWCTRTDLGTDWQLIADDASLLASWREHTYPQSPVSSVAGRTGAVILSKSDITDLPTDLLRGEVVSALPGSPVTGKLYLIPEA